MSEKKNIPISINIFKLDKLMEYIGVDYEGLLDMSLRDILDKRGEMIASEADADKEQRLHDPAFAAIVRKYLSCYDFLRRWWSDEQIVRAAALHATYGDIVSEQPYKTDKCPHKNSEFLKEGTFHFPKYDKSGNQYLESELAHGWLFRIKNQYQGLCHGKIILQLLYDTHPELEKYGFKAYSMDYEDEERYEIYPQDPNLYTPFAALMSGDIDAIVQRNLDYGRSYNHGEHTLEKTKERLESESAKEYLKLISSYKGLHPEYEDEA